jgi:ClpP class serine protease
MFDRVLELLDSKWLIHRDTAISYLPLLVAYLHGQPVAFNLEEKKGKFSKPNVLVKSFSGFNAYYAENNAAEKNIVDWDFSDPDIPENSIAFLPIQGPIFSWSNLRLIENLKKIEQNSRIIAVVFFVNSPGGQVFMTDIVAQSIKGLSKPTVGMVMNIAASAALWMTSSMNFCFATSPMDQIGSIGTYTSFTDMRGMLDKLGIKITDIYATLSTRKNEEIRALLEGNDDLLVKDLDFINEIFHQAIRENLGIDQSSEVFTGAIYYAAEAQNHGLISGICTMESVFQTAYEEGLIHKMNSYIH